MVGRLAFCPGAKMPTDQLVSAKPVGANVMAASPAVASFVAASPVGANFMVASLARTVWNTPGFNAYPF